MQLYPDEIVTTKQKKSKLQMDDESIPEFSKNSESFLTGNPKASLTVDGTLTINEPETGPKLGPKGESSMNRKLQPRN